MRKLLFLMVFFVFPLSAQEVDTVRIVHKNYTTVFSKSLRYPILVEWWNTRDKVACKNPLPRIDKFTADPKLPNESDIGKDYVGSGYDRGHMSPAADNRCSGKEVMQEAFYFTNMVPQPHALNAGDWKAVETLGRQLAEDADSLHIWAGAFGAKEKIGRVTVPTKVWKVMYRPKTNTWWAYIFENISAKQVGMVAHIVSKEEIEKLTGLKFK